jgi:hypothetical protein
VELFSSNEKQRAWLKLAKAVEEVGIDHIPCAQAPDLYYPDSEHGLAAHHVQLAKRACKTCPLLNMCATYAIKYKEEYGVWGGMSPGERKQIRRNGRA